VEEEAKRAVLELPEVKTAREGIRLLLDEMEAWLAEVSEDHASRQWQGGHDEGTFLTSWEGYHSLRPDHSFMALAATLKEKCLEWGSSGLYHGYHRKAEVHHGPEHFIIFLDFLNRILPEDGASGQAIIDAAHHLGNWVEGIPQWYDWEAHRFISVYLGTEHTGRDGLNMVEHLRLIHLALSAFGISGEERYLSLAKDYAAVWARKIVRAVAIPLYLDPEDTPSPELRQERDRFLARFLKLRSWVDRCETHVANGTPQLFINLWRLTGDEIYMKAAKKLIRPLIGEIADPYGHPAGALAGEYRRSFRDRSFDERIIDLLQKKPPGKKNFDGARMAIDPQHSWGRLSGLGKRADMPAWYVLDKNGHEAICSWPSPSALMLGYEITKDRKWVMAATTLALAKLRLGRRVYPDGRFHGCSSRSVTAVCRGHGRNWGIGDVSAVLSHPDVKKLS
jgi:hypothetical protein